MEDVEHIYGDVSNDELNVDDQNYKNYCYCYCSVIYMHKDKLFCVSNCVRLISIRLIYPRTWLDVFTLKEVGQRDSICY